ncbi:fluoride efflux transporter CrcB [Cellulomonas triticagri]|uniref:Fluoride-specific ion channel FluC n=1 Tax=Cellulomonas triticagri TaxID=2483352 RepID=A0A3M2JT51_9CELL|nr:fluoride efflux transporter CrcB [Cellulomonas triticagri]RMI13925.1 fluoride efflux transporter CrcB [Cellulomonas triticagri]
MTGALLVALAGGVGAAARFWVDGTVRARRRSVLPLGTMVVNLTGSLLIGLVTGARLYAGLPATAALLLATGFCGGYTTFSAATVEAVRLAQVGERGRAVASLAGTLVACVAAVALGIAVVGLVAGWVR